MILSIMHASVSVSGKPRASGDDPTTITVRIDIKM